jgi:hypothetical protein
MIASLHNAHHDFAMEEHYSHCVFAHMLLLWCRRLLDDLLVDHCSSFARPFLLRQLMIADDVLADGMIDLLRITPTFGIAILQPNKRRSDVRCLLPATMKILTAS